MSEYAWFNTDDGRAVYRRIPKPRAARSLFPCPTIVKDVIDPVRSMADGKMYDSMSSLRRTYRADGNPQGQEYIEIGDAPMMGPKQTPRMSKAEISDLLEKSEAMIARGEVPPVQSIDA